MGVRGGRGWRAGRTSYMFTRDLNETVMAYILMARIVMAYKLWLRAHKPHVFTGAYLNKASSKGSGVLY